MLCQCTLSSHSRDVLRRRNNGTRLKCVYTYRFKRVRIQQRDIAAKQATNAVQRLTHRRKISAKPRQILVLFTRTPSH